MYDLGGSECIEAVNESDVDVGFGALGLDPRRAGQTCNLVRANLFVLIK
jgi:hypothetical protein